MMNWFDTKASDMNGNRWYIQKAKDSEGEFVRAMLMDKNTNTPICFEDWDISEWAHYTK